MWKSWAGPPRTSSTKAAAIGARCLQAVRPPFAPSALIPAGPPVLQGKRPARVAEVRREILPAVPPHFAAALRRVPAGPRGGGGRRSHRRPRERGGLRAPRRSGRCRRPIRRLGGRGGRPAGRRGGVWVRGGGRCWAAARGPPPRPLLLLGSHGAGGADGGAPFRAHPGKSFGLERGSSVPRARTPVHVLR